MSFVNVHQIVYALLFLLVLGWDVGFDCTVLFPDHCLSIYFSKLMLRR